jgi:hypothetical protein
MAEDAVLSRAGEAGARTYRVVHWGTGATGRFALGAVLDRADFELVGHVVVNPEKEGRDSGELIGRAPVGVTATRDVEAAIALKPDVVTYFGNGVGDPLAVARDIARFLEAGINVVTTSMAELIARETASPEVLAIVEPACRRGGTSLYATGIDPGFATSQLAITAYAAAHRVDRVRLQEFADYGVYPDEPTGRHYFGFGLPLDANTPVAQGDFLKRMWSGTINENAKALGWTIQSLRTTHRTAPARQDYDTAIGRIDKGSTSAMWFQLIGTVDGAEKIILEHVNWIDAGDVPADWPTPPRYKGGYSACSYRLVVEGDPAFDVELQMKGDHDGLGITALHAVNAIPLVVAAPPGIVNQARLAPYGTGPKR